MVYVCPNKLVILSPHEGGLYMSINPGKVCLRRNDPPAFSLRKLGSSVHAAMALPSVAYLNPPL